MEARAPFFVAFHADDIHIHACLFSRDQKFSWRCFQSRTNFIMFLLHYYVSSACSVTV